MKTFVVLSCLLAVACGHRFPAYGGGGGFGASKYGFESQQQQSAHHESHQSSSQVSSAGGIASSAGGLIGGGGLVDSYGLGAGGYDASGLAASQIASNTLAARSSFGAESALAGGYGTEYGVSGLHDAAAIAGSGVGLGGGSIGGFNSYNGGSFNRQSSMTRSSSFSSSSSHQVYQYETEWPELYQVPLFKSLCGLKSTMKSQELFSTIGRTYRANQFDYGSTFTDLYTKNALLQKFFYTATGIRYQDSYRSNYVQLINQQPMHALRLATIFARNPHVFTSPYGQFIIGGSSLELLQNYQTSATRYSYESFSSSRFLTSLVRSKYYSRTLASVFGIQSSNLSYDILSQQLMSRIGGYYRSNAAGTLLLLRHVLARRQISSLEPYLGCTGADIYSSQLDGYWGQKAWRHNNYYSSWSRQFARSSSFSSSSSRSSRVMSRSLSANSMGYNGIGI